MEGEGDVGERSWSERTLRSYSPSPGSQGRQNGGTAGCARWMGPGEDKLWGDTRREL